MKKTITMCFPVSERFIRGVGVPFMSLVLLAISGSSLELRAADNVFLLTSEARPAPTSTDKNLPHSLSALWR